MTRALRLPEALLLLRAVAAHLAACLFHAHPPMAIRLTRAPVSRLVLRDRLCRLEVALLRDRAPRPPDSSLDPAPGCPPPARQRELAAEYSLDFRF